MTHFLLEPSFDGIMVLVFAIIFVGFGIPLILFLVGAFKWSKGKKQTAKTLFIIAGVYLLISGGFCLSILN